MGSGRAHKSSSSQNGHSQKGEQLPRSVTLPTPLFPVVACAIVMPPGERAIAGVDDSKRLSPALRVALATRIRERALADARIRLTNARADYWRATANYRWATAQL